jgi:predicted RNase H-like HicB family nuclease
MKKYSVIYEPVKEKEFDEGYYYAHIPSLGLTTHGFGLDGAKQAASELLELWSDDDLQGKNDIYISTLEVD